MPYLVILGVQVVVGVELGVEVVKKACNWVQKFQFLGVHPAGY